MILLLAIAAWAQDDEGWGDDDAGFADFDVEVAEPTKTSPLKAGGTLRTNQSLWVERLADKPWARGRQSLDLFLRFKKGWFRAEVSGHGEFDLPYLLFPDRYGQQTRKTYGWQLLPREVYVAASAGPLEFTVGRQRIAWGEGLLFSPVDVIAARDLRDPGMAELDDLRLPVTGVRIGWFPGKHRFEVFGVLESHWGFRSPPQGPYGALDAALEPALTNPLLAPFLEDVHFEWEQEGKPFSPLQPQAYGRWRTSIQGVDIGLYAASLLDKQGTIGFPEANTILEGGTVNLPVRHHRYTLLGHSGAATAGVLLLRWELTAELGKKVTAGDLEALIPMLEDQPTNIVNAMGGVQYSGIPNLTVDVEVAAGTELQPTENLLFPVSPVSYGTRVSYTALRERLQLAGTALGFGVGFEMGGLVRLDATYELFDGVHAQLGGITYRPGARLGPLSGLGRHDQVFGQLRWDF